MEISSAILFYVTFVLFAAIGLPLTRRFISNKVLAYVAAKAAGLILFGYFIWLLGSLKILSYQNYPVILGLFVVAVGLGGYFCRDLFLSRSVDEPQLPETGKKTKKLKILQRRMGPQKREWPFYKKILAVEGLAILVYLLYLYLRSYNSAINGTERFMDLALLSSAGKTDFFPFIDPWFAGKTINYYYYGSYLMSLISNLGKLPYALSYTFTLGLIYSQSILFSSVLVWTITNSKKAAALVAFLVTTAGTLFYAGCAIGGYMATPEKVCSYASSTRLYTPSYIINEIPSYSFTVGDLHAHLLALPFFLFGLILFYALKDLKKPDWRLVGLIALGIATSGMINAWDAITLVSLLIVLSLIKMFKTFKEEGSLQSKRAALKWPLSAGAAVCLAILLMTPYLVNFQSPVMGIGFIPSYIALHNLKDVQYPTPLLALAGMWGVFAAAIFYMIIFRRKQLAEHLFLISMMIVCSGILLGVELFFIKDIYSVANPPYFRANTTFKFGFHAWVMLSIIFSVLVTFIYRDRTAKDHATGRVAAFFLVLVSVVGGLVYPREAIKQFYTPSINYVNKTLDGSGWMKNNTPNDWETVKYINGNIHKRSVIAEAVGDSYTTFSRIATFTGMITPMGWKTHEWTWRFEGKNAENAAPGVTVETGWGAVAKVAEDIKTLYATADISEARRIIEQYGIEYVYIGDMERTTYFNNLEEQKFFTLGTMVFESGGSRLFKVNSN
jgi:uncharacterized membrane protein